MSMEFKMGYTNPAANAAAKAAKRKGIQAKRDARVKQKARDAHEIGKRINIAVSEAVDEVDTKIADLSRKVEAITPASPDDINAPPTFGRDRPWQSKDLSYRIRGVDEDHNEMVSAATGDSVPAAYSDSYFSAVELFEEILDIYKSAHSWPTSFRVYEEVPGQTYETLKSVGYGTLNRQFIEDDPKFLARDLAHMQTLLRERGLFMLFDVKEELLKFLTPSEDAASAAPPFEGEQPVTISFQFWATKMESHVRMYPGEQTLDEYDGLWNALWVQYVKIFSAHLLPRPDWDRDGDGKMRPRKPLELYPDFINFVIYRPGYTTSDGLTCLYATKKPGEIFYVADKIDDGLGLRAIGHGWMSDVPIFRFGQSMWEQSPSPPKFPNQRAQIMAHFACRMASLGYVVALAPRDDDKAAGLENEARFGLRKMIWDAAAWPIRT